MIDAGLADLSVLIKPSLLFPKYPLERLKSVSYSLPGRMVGIDASLKLVAHWRIGG